MLLSEKCAPDKGQRFASPVKWWIHEELKWHQYKIITSAQIEFK